ncbi:hypothetical protein BB934_36050 (plasmid) [Microvirga ossetica]|uniref:Uncharacterized protein n=1 Tax=Microvirga ossetica TaxID=1882682 RepID=A0A1B2EUM0_9HYPH|nr:hypothetical protein [Microvirga ossetica]ANY83664.1 hypothetical protein BB934_36050 [Microvirga ossetica]
MTTFNPGDWPRLPDWLDPHKGRHSPQAINREALERCCMVVAFCLCFAALAPPHLMPAAFAGLLLLAGITSIGFALMRGDRPLASHLTAWDEAALLFTASLGLHLWLGPFPIN